MMEYETSVTNEEYESVECNNELREGGVFDTIFMNPSHYTVAEPLEEMTDTH